MFGVHNQLHQPCTSNVSNMDIFRKRSSTECSERKSVPNRHGLEQVGLCQCKVRTDGPAGLIANRAFLVNISNQPSFLVPIRYSCHRVEYWGLQLGIGLFFSKSQHLLPGRLPARALQSIDVMVRQSAMLDL